MKPQSAAILPSLASGSAADESIYIGDANDPATILADSDVFYSAYFAASDDDEVAAINASFTPSATPPYWELGRRTSEFA